MPEIKLNVKAKPGQYVWVWEEYVTMKETECLACKGKAIKKIGKVTYRCQDCDGRGKHPFNKKIVKCKPRRTTVLSVEFRWANYYQYPQYKSLSDPNEPKLFYVLRSSPGNTLYDNSFELSKKELLATKKPTDSE